MNPVMEPRGNPVRVRVAAGFLARLRGLVGAPPLVAGEGMWLTPCCAVHTFGMTQAIDVVFVDADGCVVAVHPHLPPRRMRVCWSARATLELVAGFAGAAGIRPGTQLQWVPQSPGRASGCVVAVRQYDSGWRGPASHRRGCGGSAMLEWLIAAPLVLLLGLGALQWGLLFHARQALDYALLQAARAGAVGAARASAIESGLAQGLLPYFAGAAATRPLALALPDSIARIRAGQRAGWLQWRQISPTRASFDDWGEPARDAHGDTVPGEIEIPNDNLRHRTRAIGANSGQTLADANLLKLELIYGIPLPVPLIGPLAVWWMEIRDGCRGPAARVLGAVPLPAMADARAGGSTAAPADSQSWRCSFYRAADEHGRAVARWPVRVHALVRMHSPARLSALTPAPGTPAAGRDAAAGSAPTGGSTGAGTPQSLPTPNPPTGASPLLDAWALQLPPPAQLNPGGSDASRDGSATRAGDFLQVGAERTLPLPGSCGPG